MGPTYKKIKKIGKEYFHLAFRGFHDTKREAKVQANRERNRGNKVRTVKLRNSKYPLYGVYIHK